MKVKFLQKQEIQLDINKTISGNLVIDDSPDYQIMINPKNRKIITFPKETFSDGNENRQLEFFNFLLRQSAIKHDSVQSGFVFGSYDALYPEGEEENSLNYLLYCISEFFKVKIPELKKEEEYAKKRREFILEPDDEHSTDLGDVPHEERKGSIHHDLRPNYTYSYYLYEGKGQSGMKIKQEDLHKIIKEEYKEAKRLGWVLKEEQEQEQEVSEEEAARIGKNYAVNDFSEIENLGQLTYHLMKEEQSLTNKFRDIFSNKLNMEILKSSISIVTGLLLGPFGLFKGAVAAEVISKAISKGLDKFQVADAQRGEAAVYKLFDLDDELKALITGHIKDTKMEPLIRSFLLRYISERVIGNRKDWADIKIDSFVENMNASKMQWWYSNKFYQISKEGDEPNVAKILTKK